MSDEIETVVPEAINVLLTVEQHQDGQYYVRFGGQELLLATPINWQQEQYGYLGNGYMLRFDFSALYLENK